MSVAVVVFSAAAAASVRAAGADSISSAKARETTLQHEVTAAAGRIRSLTLAYEEASSQAAALAQQVSSDQANVVRLQHSAAATAGELRTDAIMSYTGGMAAAPGAGPRGTDSAIRAAYLDVAAGALSDTVDLYHTEEAQVASAESVLASELKASRAAEDQADGARRAALAVATSVQAQLVSVAGQIRQLEAAQAAAAANAVQGLPVNGGLVSVVTTVVAPGGGGNAGGVWLQLRECESGNNYRADTGNGFYGAYQFSQQTWSNLGYPGRPDLEPPAMQDQAAQKLQSESGWGQWPACSAALGLS